MNDKFHDKIEELYTLQSNWDNRGAKEISALSIKNLMLLKKELGDWDFDRWQIAPGVNGDIFINHKGRITAGFVLDGHRYSWFMEDHYTLSGGSDLWFDAETIVERMNEIEIEEMKA